MRVRRDRGDPIALLDTERCERGGPSIAAFAELRVREPQLSVDYGLTLGIQLAGAAREIERCELCFHGQAELPTF